MSSLAWLGPRQLVDGFRAGDFSPLDLVDEIFDRIDRFDSELNVFVHLDRSSVREEAQRMSAAYASGKVDLPLLGVPVAVKDIINVQGQPTTCNSRVRPDHIASQDAAVVRRLREAGALIFAKVNTYEFALGGPSFDSLFPPPRNPWNTDLHPAGSSSGSGVGLAGGMFPLALGTDTAGSIRHPASACGIVGLKPTYSLLPLGGVFPVSPSLDHVGPMARNVEDTALLFSAMGPGSLDGPGQVGEGSCLEIDSLRIGFVRQFQERDYVADPAIAAAIEHALGLVTAAGADLEDVELPPIVEFETTTWKIVWAEAWSIHAETMRRAPELFGERTRNALFAGAFLTAGDYISAQSDRLRLSGEIDRVLADVDVLIAAGSMDPPCRIDDAEAIARTYFRSARIPFSLSGHPALSLPISGAGGDLPVSLQVVGKMGQDETVLKVGAMLERICGSKFRPPEALA